MKKYLLQKLVQLIDANPNKQELKDDYLELKFNDFDIYLLTLKNKYTNEI